MSLNSYSCEPELMDFKIYTLETAPDESKGALQQAEQTFKFIPNLEGILAESPATLKSGMALWDLFETTSFTPRAVSFT